MTFEEWFHKEYEPADLQLKHYAEEKENLQIPAELYLEDIQKAYEAGLKAGKPKWHKVADGKLPELDKKVWTIRGADDDMPVVAKRHIYTSYGRTEWEWECYWGSGFDLKQNEIFAWCEIPQFKDKVE